MKQANAYLRELYLDYFNNYLTVEKMAEHHEMHVEDMQNLIDIGRELHEEYVKMLKGKKNTFPSD